MTKPKTPKPKKLPDNVFPLFSKKHGAKKKEEVTPLGHLCIGEEIFFFGILNDKYVCGRPCPDCGFVHILDKDNPFCSTDIDPEVYSPFQYISAILPLLEYVYEIENPDEDEE